MAHKSHESKNRFKADPALALKKIAALEKQLNAHQSYLNLFRRNMIEGLPVKGSDFFNSMVKRLGTVLKADYMFIGVLKGNQMSRIRTISLYADGDIAQNLEYDLKHTPCENVVGKIIRVYKTDVAGAFPKDRLLVEMGVNGYIGVPLFDSQFKKMGIMVALFKGALTDTLLAETLFLNFATRIANEIERQKIETSLRVSEGKYRLLFENANDTIFIIDPITLRFLEVNEKATKHLGYTREEFLQLSLKDIYPRKALKHIETIIKKLKEKGSILFENIQIRKDGKEVPVEINSRVFEYEGRQVIHSFVRDITVRKQAEKKLLYNKEYLEKLNNSLGEAVFTVKMPERKIEYVNNEVKNIFGYVPDECIGKATEMFYPSEKEYFKFGRKLQNIIKQGKNTYKTEQLLKRKSGEVFPSEITTTFLKENNVIVRSISIIRDITERVNSKRILLQQKKSLEQKNIALGEVLGQMELEKKQIKDDVMANAEYLLLPIIQKLKLKGESRKYLKMLQKNLQELTSSFGSTITKKSAKLTSREIEICSMIKNGLTSKEISDLLTISLRTTEKHRANIRKKLGILNKNFNLTSFLKTF